MVVYPLQNLYIRCLICRYRIERHSKARSRMKLAALIPRDESSQLVQTVRGRKCEHISVHESPIHPSTENIKGQTWHRESSMDTVRSRQERLVKAIRQMLGHNLLYSSILLFFLEESSSVCRANKVLKFPFDSHQEFSTFSPLL